MKVGRYFKSWKGGCSIALIAMLIATGVAFIPFETTMVPQWRIQVVDEKGVPYRGNLVREFCFHYTLDADPCQTSADSMQLTDESGFVDFPERTIRLSAAARLFRSVYTFLGLFIHGSWGTDISVDSSGPKGFKTVKYDGNGELPDKIVLPRE